MSLIKFFTLPESTPEPKTRKDFHDCTLEVDGIEDDFSIRWDWYSWPSGVPHHRDIFVTHFDFDSPLQHDRALAEEAVKDAIRNWFWVEFNASITFEI